MFKSVKKITKVIQWIALLLRILVAIKNVLNGSNNGPIEVADDNKNP